MFAGLPGIGVGTLFYILMGLFMPFYELANVVRGTSSLARWRGILRQCFFAVSIIGSIMLAERVLMWILGATSTNSLNPARLLNQELSTRAPESIYAAPMFAALLLLVGVLVLVELLHVINGFRRRPATAVKRERPAERLAFEPPRLSSAAHRRISTSEREQVGAVASD